MPQAFHQKDFLLGPVKFYEKKVFLFSEPSRVALGTKIATIRRAQGSCPVGKNGRGVTLITHLHLVPSLRMSGIIPLLFLYAFLT
jgi:hypothetical protein